jgi:hypothetical protein
MPRWPLADGLVHDACLGLRPSATVPVELPQMSVILNSVIHDCPLISAVIVNNMNDTIASCVFVSERDVLHLHASLTRSQRLVIACSAR